MTNAMSRPLDFNSPFHFMIFCVVLCFCNFRLEMQRDMTHTQVQSEFQHLLNILNKKLIV